jgi:putative ATP-dependent endonuclease of OLD family
MRLAEVKLINFRGYATATSISFDSLTLLVGRNDAGKSSILDALDIFFNDSSIEKDDCNVHTGSTEISISCVFDNLPAEVVIDEQFPTTLAGEFLLRSDGRLEIKKTYGCAAAKGKCTAIAAIAMHPSVGGLQDLLSLKINDLKQRARQQGVNLDGANQTIKSHLRRAIWAHAGSLDLSEQEMNLNKDSGREIWDQLQRHLPVYAVFKSDRASTDQDSEAQDPLKAAIKEAIKRRETELDSVLADIQRELESVARRTVEKIREMNEDLARELTPTVKTKNWDSLFGVSLTGDDAIPINKRGSGTRRLVLLIFFRAKAEDASLAKESNIIYAVEEPETSQHPNHQLILLEAFEELAEQGHCQVILTTHTPTLARRINRKALRLIDNVGGVPAVEYGNNDATLKKIKTTLGVLPDHDVKAFFGVEGKHDIHFLRRISAILAPTESDIPDLEVEEKVGRLVLLSLGGSNMDSWINTMAGFDRPEFYLTDRDNPPPADPKYQTLLAQWAARGCTAWVTSKRELENYLCPTMLASIQAGYAGTGADFEDVPALFAEAAHNAAVAAGPWATLDNDKRKSKESRAKRLLNTIAISNMTPALLTRNDANDEIRTWLRELGRALRQ